jgi:hypothetical protein
MNSFFRELKQRKVYRAALGYAAVAWLVVQLGATVMPAYHTPEWILAVLYYRSRAQLSCGARLRF